MPVKSAIFKENIFLSMHRSFFDPEKYNQKNRHPNNDMKRVQTGHEKIKTEIQQMSMLEFHHQLRARLNAMMELCSPFEIFIYQEDQCHEHSDGK
jgi:hypothetical protein